MDTNTLYLGILHGVFMLTTSSMTSKFDVSDVSLIGTLNLEAFFCILLIKVNSKVRIFLESIISMYLGSRI